MSLAIFLIVMILILIALSVTLFFVLKSNKNDGQPQQQPQPQSQPQSQPDLESESTENTTPTQKECKATVIDYCRAGWRSQGGKKKWGAGGIKWTMESPNCASEFDIKIQPIGAGGMQTVNIDASKNEFRPVLDTDSGKNIYSFAIQGRDQPLSADAFRGDTQTFWTITPKVSDPQWVSASTVYSMNSDNGRCTEADSSFIKPFLTQDQILYNCYNGNCD